MPADVDSKSDSFDVLPPGSITEEYVSYRIHFVPPLRLTYLANPKAASSTLKKTLWLSASPSTYTGNPQLPVRNPFVGRFASTAELSSLLQSTFFSAVRNPYVRALSAYLDKAGTPQRDHNVWDLFARRFEIDPDSYPTFRDFLYLLRVDEPHRLDAHFRPQYFNLLGTLLWPDFVGHVESMDEIEDFVRSKGLTLASHSPHKTNAIGKLSDWYGSKEIDAVQMVYERDFEAYGYSFDPNIIRPVRTITLKRHHHGLEKLLGKRLNAKPKVGRAVRGLSRVWQSILRN